MGCSSSRPIPNVSVSSDSMSYKMYEETESQIGNPHVHWDDSDDDDYFNDQNVDASMNFRDRVMSSRGPRSAGARSRVTTTTAGETFEGSEYFDM